MESGQAPRVIIISLMKSGTHLLQELMTALGYKMYGAGVRLRPEIVPVLDLETRWRIARIAYDKQTAAALEDADEAYFTEATDRAWDALSWSWHIRFNQPLTTWFSRAMVETGFIEKVHRRAVGSDFADTPANVCWVFNQFDITRLDGHFLREWVETGEPRIIFNYRDPRDMTLSMVNFLCGKTGRGFSNYNDFLVFSEILKSKATFGEQLAYALTDPAFPPADQHMLSMLWLLNHPNVCKTSFEDLVGPRGGGSAEVQARTLTRIFDFLGVTDADTRDVAGQLFNPEVFSFYKGQIGGWRTAFTPEHRRLALERFGDVLRLYGYE
ncbi:MAG TPA: sulfotransferase domain-containing protein [Streptosporangiaceae bacterium]